MKKLLQIVLVSSLSLLCFSCYYDTEIEEIIPETDEPVLFSTQVEPIFSKCTLCHNGNIDPDLSPGKAYNALKSNYVTAGDADNSRLYQMLPGLSGSGHKDIPAANTLSVDEIALIRAWINQGALEN